ncbi:MAG: hypothetical protein FWC16_05255 [Defluviitaleaceae bacterium]|nr:hypothetical protein [Defluviitaleaceae bacterium]MCL2274315.1 hypothetical protein [Defluviitaleaceae bacterium]
MQTNEQKKGFTKREKRLLLLMTVIGFSALMIVYVIIPLFNRVQDETDRYNALSLDMMQFQMLLARTNIIRDNHARAIDEFYAARERFLNEDHVGEISRMLTLLCLSHNLDVLSQRITPPVQPAEWDAFLVMTATKTLSGRYADVKRFLDTIENTEYLRVTRFSFSMREPEGNEPRVLERFNIILEVIMMQDLDV